MAVYRGSRYVRTPLAPGFDQAVLAQRKRPSVSLKGSTHYTVMEGDTIDLIAHKMYNRAGFWWAIMDANPSYQFEFEIKVGDILVIPAFTEVVKSCG